MNKHLDSMLRNKQQTIDYLIANVEELRFIKNTEDGDHYEKILWEGYVDECNSQRRLMSEDEFIEDMDNSIGWDWVFDADEV